MFPDAKWTEGTTEVERKQYSLFPAEPVIKCLAIPPNSKIENNSEIICQRQAGFKEYGPSPKFELLS